jgi:2-methylcitrate dehydratase PrpD
VTVRLKNGRSIEETCQFFPGMPQRPLTADELRAKFDALTGSLPPAQAARLFEQCMALETVADVSALALR